MPHIWFFFLRLCFCKLWSAASSKLKRILILKQTCYKDVEFFLRQQRTTLSSSVSFLSIRDQTTCACWSKKKEKKVIGGYHCVFQLSLLRPSRPTSLSHIHGPLVSCHASVAIHRKSQACSASTRKHHEKPPQSCILHSLSSISVYPRSSINPPSFCLPPHWYWFPHLLAGFSASQHQTPYDTFM